MTSAEKFACSSFARFINSPVGRAARVLVGAGLIVWGLTHPGESAAVYIIVGIIPLAAGALDLCLISPLLGGPISGKRVREAGRKI